MKYKYREGDIVKHKAGGPKMVIIGLAWFGHFAWEPMWHDTGKGVDGDPKDDRDHEPQEGYLCRFFFPRSADTIVANTPAEGQGKYKSRYFFEYRAKSTRSEM